MIKNIPNKYTQEMLKNEIEQEFRGMFDFLYLPIDFKNNCNYGYAFINFEDLHSVGRFCRKFQRRKWDISNSKKICEVVYAKIQGKEALVRRFKYSKLKKHQEPRFQPYIKK